MHVTRPASDPPPHLPDGAPYYGWRVVGAVCVMLSFTSGLAFYNQSVLLDALVREKGFGVAATSLATTLFFFANGLAGLLVAALMERYDVRITITVGALLASSALACLPLVERLWQAYLVFILFGFGFAGASMVPGTTLITRWFERRRSAALALATTGLSLGGILWTPLAARAIERHGLATAAPWLALALFLGIVPVALLFVRDRPERLGLRPFGAAGTPAAVIPGAQRIGLSQALRSRFFVFLVAAFGFGLMGQVGAMAHQFKLIADLASPATAAKAVSVLAACSMVGRLLSGWLLRWLPMRGFALALLAAQAVTIVLLGLSRDATSALIGSGLFGLTVGSVLLMQSLLLAEAFGAALYARLFSISSVVAATFVSTGPALLGLVHDLADGYPMAYLTAAGATVVAIFLLGSAGPVAQALPPSPLTADRT